MFKRQQSAQGLSENQTKSDNIFEQNSENILQNPNSNKENLESGYNNLASIDLTFLLAKKEQTKVLELKVTDQNKEIVQLLKVVSMLESKLSIKRSDIKSI